MLLLEIGHYNHVYLVDPEAFLSGSQSIALVASIGSGGGEAEASVNKYGAVRETDY